MKHLWNTYETPMKHLWNLVDQRIETLGSGFRSLGSSAFTTSTGKQLLSRVATSVTIDQGPRLRTTKAQTNHPQTLSKCPQKERSDSRKMDLEMDLWGQPLTMTSPVCPMYANIYAYIIYIYIYIYYILHVYMPIQATTCQSTWGENEQKPSTSISIDLPKSSRNDPSAWIAAMGQVTSVTPGSWECSDAIDFKKPRTEMHHDGLWFLVYLS